ncbi:hypothetical protein JL722_824 [Aureococcus anophagefferens]|nr:hypothetical protein JL722_824 [Aureococcus anophagefferens]
MRALLPLAAYAAAQAAPRYTLRVSYDGKEKALVLYPGVEPADAAAAFVFDHAPRDAAASFESIVDHLCGRFACARRTARDVLFPLDLTLPGSGRRARMHVHDGDEPRAAEAVAARHGFLGDRLQADVERTRGPFVVLGVRDAEVSAIKRAYRELSKAHHPDRGGDEAVFVKVARAYEAVGDDDAKRRFLEAEELKRRPPPLPSGFNLVIQPGTVFYFRF